jgi:hypothetical protein
MTRAVPRDRSPGEALGTVSAVMLASAGAHATRPGTLTPPVGGDAATKMAIPDATPSPPMMPFRMSGSRFLWAIIGSANSTSVATSGWTSASGDDPVAGLQQGRDLLVPGPAAERVSVDQDHGLARAVVFVVDLDVGGVFPVDGNRGHGVASCSA